MVAGGQDVQGFKTIGGHIDGCRRRLQIDLGEFAKDRIVVDEQNSRRFIENIEEAGHRETFSVS